MGRLGTAMRYRVQILMHAETHTHPFRIITLSHSHLHRATYARARPLPKLTSTLHRMHSNLHRHLFRILTLLRRHPDRTTDARIRPLPKLRPPHTRAHHSREDLATARGIYPSSSVKWGQPIMNQKSKIKKHLP